MKMKMNMEKKSGWKPALHIQGGIILVAAVTGVAMWLWNALVPDIFGWGRVGYWQMLGLLALAHIFFGRFHSSMSMHRHRHHHGSHDRRHLHDMSREERREFIRRRMRAFDHEENPTDDAGKEE